VVENTTKHLDAIPRKVKRQNKSDPGHRSQMSPLSGPSAFHPALAPVGVLLAVLGYALGTYGGWLSGQLMRIVAPE
jgi:hypothetical protein